jgi:hypothetical protein
MIYLAIILVPMVIILFLIGTLGWIWSISIYLNYSLPLDMKLKTSPFRWLFFFVVLFFVYVISTYLLSSFGLFEFYLSPRTIGLLFIIMLGMVFWLAGFAAKTIKSIEIKRIATFPEYISEFFLINLSFIGYWILQPRINKIFEK